MKNGGRGEDKILNFSTYYLVPYKDLQYLWFQWYNFSVVKFSVLCHFETISTHQRYYPALNNFDDSFHIEIIEIEFVKNYILLFARSLVHVLHNRRRNGKNVVSSNFKMIVKLTYEIVELVK